MTVIDEGTFEAAARSAPRRPRRSASGSRPWSTRLGRVVVAWPAVRARRGGRGARPSATTSSAPHRAEARAALDESSAPRRAGRGGQRRLAGHVVPTVLRDIAQWEGIVLRSRRARPRTPAGPRDGARCRHVESRCGAGQLVPPGGSYALPACGRSRAARAPPPPAAASRRTGRAPGAALQRATTCDAWCSAATGSPRTPAAERAASRRRRRSPRRSEPGSAAGALPESQCRADLEAGRLVRLGSHDHVDVPLHWQVWRLRSPLIDDLAATIQHHAPTLLAPLLPRAPACSP